MLMLKYLYSNDKTMYLNTLNDLKKGEIYPLNSSEVAELYDHLFLNG